MITVYDDSFYKSYADTDACMTLKDKMILEYERDVFKRILEIIANCSDKSTLSGIKELAKMTLEGK